MSDNEDIEKVAIIGMSGAFPGARNIDELWKLLVEKREGISTVSRDELLASGEPASVIDDPAYVPRGGFIDDAEMFDHEFFGVSPSEALVMDPQQRLFLSHARLALEDAGHVPESLKVPVGVYAGESPTQYWFLLREGPYSRSLDDFKIMLGNEKDFIATRTSYKLNLKGPSLDVQSACSTSLAAVGLACQALLTWNCDLALAGGATVTAPRKRGYTAYEGMIVSPSGICRPFDERANGTLFGEGVGVVVLKRLSEALADGDYVYAVIDAVAMNNDGADKVGFTAPSVNGQAEAIEMAHSLADVSPEDIGYVETHGTATALGDPIEVQALSQAFRKGTAKNGFCRIGSIKANIGHLDATAGIASLIKTALIVNTGIIPPLLNFERPNPHLDLESTPFLIPTEPVRWEPASGKRIAGLSSFGIGGTNVHAIIESPPRTAVAPQAETPPVLLSAKSPQALAEYAARVAAYVTGHPEVPLPALAARLQRARADHPWRQGYVFSGKDDLLEALAAPLEDLVPASKGKVMFAFPGQGSQFPAMARLYHGVLPTFTQWIDKGIALAATLGIPEVATYLLQDGHETEIARTETTQPLLYILEHAFARELLARGVKPAALVGHSIGEYVAATIGGALSFEDGLRLVWKRGYFMQRAPEGAMLAIPGSIDEVQKYAREGIYLSVYNTERQVVLGGSLDAIAGLERLLTDENVEFKRLRTSHAFHSPLMDPILESFAEEVRKVRFQPLTIPMLSNLDGTWRTGTVDWNDYWVRQLRQPVRFDQCIATLAAAGDYRVVEAGPGRALTGFLRSALPDNEDVFPVLPNARTPVNHFEKTLVRFWERGIDVAWAPTPRWADSLVLFPGYPFARKPFWPAATSSGARSYLENTVTAAEDTPAVETGSGPVDDVRRVWRRVLGHGNFANDVSFFLCGADSFAGIQLLKALKDDLGLDLKMPELLLDPTVEALAGRIGSAPVEPVSASQYLFPLQTKGSAPPLFMVAGAHGNDSVVSDTPVNHYEQDFYRYFSNLIAHLGDRQPLYGFKPKGLTLTQPLHSSVKVMAEAYILAMKEIQPEGPYFLGGECVGGIVALEMAAQLEARGETVSRVFLLDTPRPTALVGIREEAFMLGELVRTNLRHHLHHVLAEGFPYVQRELFPLISLLWPLLFPVTDRLRLLRRAMNGPRFYMRALLAHRPGLYGGRVVYIINRTWNRQGYLMGWTREIGRNLEVVEVPGEHQTRMKISGHRIGQVIRRSIDSALRE